jgi:outer membrane protein OmpA-like peptidoglycan-associated protein
MLYKAGAIASYNLNAGLSVFGELEGSYVPDQFDGVVSGDWFHDFYLTPSVGLTYRFKGSYRGFETGLSAGEITDMNDKINNLNASNQELSKQKVSLEKDNISLKKDLATVQSKIAEKSAEAVTTAADWIKGSKIILGGVVKFDTDKSVCQAGEEAKIAEAAAELKKQKDVVIELGGYASKEGNNWYNMMLSNKRAKFVAELLKSKYDVPASQIEIVPYGVSKNPMTDDGKNKVVVFFLKKK